MTDPDEQIDREPESLKSMDKNPWYVLATIHGEQGKAFDEELHAQNRGVWNRWAGLMFWEGSERVAIAEALGVNPSELSPLSNDAKLTKLVESEFKRRIGPSAKIPEPKHGCDFGKTRFSTKLCMNQFIFPRSADFCLAKFESEAMLSGVLFEGDAFFGSATFAMSSKFDSVCFRKSGSFRGCHFLGECEFNAASFGGVAWFDSARFDKEARLTKIDFGNDVFFRKAMVKGNFRMCRSEFRSYSNFSETKFEREVDLSDAHFRHTTNFRGVEFVRSFPELSGTILHPNTIFTAEDAYWPPTKGSIAKTSRDSVAIIRHTISKQGSPEDEHYFFRREMGFRARIGGFWQRLPYALYQCLSDFGYSIRRPVISLSLLWFLFGALFFCFSVNSSPFQETDMQSLLVRLGAAFALSFANIFAFLGFHGRFAPDIFDGAGPVQVFLSAFQTVAGFILLFFLGLGLRTRFRLR